MQPFTLSDSRMVSNIVDWGPFGDIFAVSNLQKKFI